ncbi:MAG: methylenetetrahydrofolate--tRNA-(uracil(54)-C(5))-methyltransferase (FADH(2)-oxidizing) TrmFO [Desulfuromonas sp.]|nr:MAG: methylenetetrahydrofolate--tRNA-(uracil(54)-C(5))-methyltransferase (FADH(2)-oxidizing) TrmFO [Desulfuromonas sp.]
MSGLPVTIIGGGLAGCEAAWQLATRNVPVRLLEMKPSRFSPAHHSDDLAELVCSNSLRGAGMNNAVGLLKEELRRAGSLFIQGADATEVPAGGALAVDRDHFAAWITEKISKHPDIELLRQEGTAIPESGPVIVASGPLTSEPLAEAIAALTGDDQLYFYDAIAPIVEADSIDRDIVFEASRYDKGGDDYLNIPLDKEQYHRFVSELKNAEKVPTREFEKAIHFEGCMPIETLAERGEMTLAFGPLKPVGLNDPRTGKPPFAVIQLRLENRQGTLYNLVGCQTKLTYPEQKRLLRSLPGMGSAVFARLGSMHRNTFINAPSCLNKTLQLKNNPRILFAGQITGVEGYVESAACGWLAGLFAHALVNGQPLPLPPETTGLAALLRHLSESDAAHFQPSNINYGLFPPLEKRFKKRDRRLKMAERALADLDSWLPEIAHDT